MRKLAKVTPEACAADGHRAPYGLKHLELGNEEAVNEDYWNRFKPLAEAIWAKDPGVILVVGDFAYDKAIVDPYNFSGAPSIKSLAAHKKILDLAQQHDREVWFDVHIGTEQPPAPNGLPGVRSFIEQLGRLSPGARYKVAVFEFNASIAYAIIDGLTGGSGMAASNPGQLTDIDKAILSKVVDALLKRYSAAWAPYMAITATIASDSNTSPLDQVFPQTDSMLVSGYELSLGAAGGTMTVCIPAVAVESVLPMLDVNRSTETSAKQDPLLRQAIQASLDEAALTCRAILGRTTLTAEDVINLQTGDIIRLDARPNSEIEFWVGNSHSFSASPGRAGRNMGIKITKVR